MNTDTTHDFLVISRGQWDADAAKEDIQQAIDDFYVWLTSSIEAGKMKMGSRLGTAGATVSKRGIVTDGPFGESKEAIGGYWIIVASSLREAAKLAAQNPCTLYGLIYEIRPLEDCKASAFEITNETPAQG